MTLPKDWYAITKEEDKSLADADVKAWRLSKSRHGRTGKYKDWPRDLWGWKYIDIIEFLYQRRISTDDPSEYYDTLPYLSNNVPSVDLDITFTNFRARMNIAGSFGTLKQRKARYVQTRTTTKQIKRRK
jgi:hypothetical protein